MDQPKVWILDDDPAVARMLEAEGFTVCAWSHARELMGQEEFPLSGCLIVNLSMCGVAGLELQRELAARQWPLRTIFVTSPDDISSAVRAMKAGASSCLARPVQRGQLLEAVHEAFTQSRAVRAQLAMQQGVRQMLRCLTPREREVLDLAVKGLLVKQIAERLGTAEKTIKTHKSHLMRKMQVRSTLALARLLIAAGLSPVPWAHQPRA